MNINERVAILEEKVRTDKETCDKRVEDLENDLTEVKTRLSSYDRLAAKCGGILMGFLVIGSLIGGQVDSLIKKIMAIFQ